MLSGATILCILSIVLVPASSALAGYYNDSKLEGERAILPCNVTSSDNISLVLWYKGASEEPIYTVDARPDVVGNIQQHFIHDDWKKRIDFDISNKPIAVLRMEKVTLADDGIYRCRVDFQHSRTRIYQILLSIIVPPSAPNIIDEMGRKVDGSIGPYDEGGPVRLTCISYDGKPPPTMSWWREGIRLKSGKNELKQGSVRNSLFIPKLSRKDLHAHLECQVSNNNRTSPARKRVIIELNLKPKEVKITSSKKPLSANKLVTLTCQTSGSRPPAILTWWKGSKKMTKADNTYLEDGNISKSVLTMVPSSEDNNVYLACRSENPNMPNSAKEDGFKLKIYYIPVVTLVIASPSNNDEPYEGEDVFFDCHAQAAPKVHKVQWFLNNLLLKRDPKSGIEISPWTLSILKVNSSNRGKYVCVAKNSEGTGWSNPIYLTVKHAPVCKKSVAVNYGIALGETANVLCQVEANPSDVTFHWSFNNSVDHMNMVSFTVDGLNSIARYKAADHNDYGNLLCWAENSVGIQSKPCVYVLAYAGPPDPPYNCTVGNGSMSMLEVYCIAGYNGGLNQTFVMEVYDETTQQLRANVTNEEDPRFIARNLPPGSSFYVMVYSVNSKGPSQSLAVAGHTVRSQFYEKDRSPIGFAISPLVIILIGIVIFCVFVASIILTVVWRRKKPIRKGKVSENTQSQARIQKTEVCIPAQNNYYTDEKNPDIIPFISGVTEEECKLYYSVPLTHINSASKNHQRNHVSNRVPANGASTTKGVVVAGGTNRKQSQQQSSTFSEDSTYRNNEEDLQYPSDISSKSIPRPEGDSWKSSHSSSNSRFGSISRLRIRMSDAAIDNEDGDHHPTAKTPLMDILSHSESAV